METRNEVKVFKIDKIFNKCKQGNMISTGALFVTCFVYYEH